MDMEDIMIFIIEVTMVAIGCVGIKYINLIYSKKTSELVLKIIQLKEQYSSDYTNLKNALKGRDPYERDCILDEFVETNCLYRPQDKTILLRKISLFSITKNTYEIYNRIFPFLNSIWMYVYTLANFSIYAIAGELMLFSLYDERE